MKTDVSSASDTTRPQSTRVRFITGMECTRPGIYVFDRYADHTTDPKPASDEMFLSMKRGQIFPPVRSAGKSAWWRWEGER
jgi:hypothetical protein